MAAGLRAVGADARRALSRARTRHRRVEFSAPLRHDLYPAGVLRVRAAQDAGAADDRRQGHHRDRQGIGAAGAPLKPRQLSGPGQGRRRAHAACAARRIPRARPRAADPGPGSISQGAAGRIADRRPADGGAGEVVTSTPNHRPHGEEPAHSAGVSNHGRESVPWPSFETHHG